MKSKPSPEPSPTEIDAAVDAETMLEILLAEAPLAPPRIDGVVVGRLVAFDPQASPPTARVTWPGCASPEGAVARVFTPLDASHGGRDVALLFEGGDPQRPVVMGMMFVGEAPPVATASSAAPLSVTADGERLVFSAEREIEFRCGEASIMLTRAGKVLIRGAYVLTHASGLNRIQGGAVKIN